MFSSEITSFPGMDIGMAIPPMRRSRRNSGPRPLVEQLQRIDIADLCRWRVFPEQHDWHKARFAVNILEPIAEASLNFNSCNSLESGDNTARRLPPPATAGKNRPKSRVGLAL
jgi:hypothetical protein